LLDLSPREKLVAVALVVPMFWIGVHPSTFMNPLDRAVSELVETVTRRAPDLAQQPPQHQLVSLARERAR